MTPPATRALPIVAFVAAVGLAMAVYLSALMNDGDGTTIVVHATPATTTTAAPRRWTWDQLADCESGKWDRHRRPIPGSRNWASRAAGYEGGVHFAPTTWDRMKPTGYPDHAWQAPRAQQIVVAERVLARSGPGQWPVCSRKIGMR